MFWIWVRHSSRCIHYSMSRLFESWISSKCIRLKLILISYMGLLMITVLLIDLKLLHLLWKLLLLSWVMTVITAVVYTCPWVSRMWCDMVLLWVPTVVSLILNHWIILIICLLCDMLGSSSGHKCAINWVLSLNKSILSGITYITLCIHLKRHLS